MLLLLTALAGCNDFGFDPIDGDPPPPRILVEESFVQAPLLAVDLLFVVDNTASMAQEQVALAEDFAVLAGALADAGVRWHVGVTTTDMLSDEAGWLTGDPWILTPDVQDATAAFAASVQVGTDGSPPEAGLAAALRALELAQPGRPNAGFLRSDALLHVLVVSDADDESDTWFDGGDPVSGFLEGVRVLGLDPTVSALVGDLPSGCTSHRGSARPGERYHRVVQATGGTASSICNVDFSRLLGDIADMALVWPDTFTLREEPVDGTLRVSVGGERTDAWVLLDPPAVQLDTPPAPGAFVVVTYAVEVE